MFNYNKIKDEKLLQVFELDCSDSVITKECVSESDRLSKNINLPGFRKGHVPLKVIEEKYGKSVRYNVFEKLMQSTINKIIDDDGLDIDQRVWTDFRNELLYELNGVIKKYYNKYLKENCRPRW